MSNGLNKYIIDKIGFIKRHRKIVENFFSMTVINVLNTSFQLVIYPILLRRVGPEAYGHYVFAFSIATYFVTVVAFGFDMVGLRYISIAEEKDDHALKEKTVNSITTAKIYLTILSCIVYLALIFFIPAFKAHSKLYLSLLFYITATTIVPSWYFQAKQNTKILLYIQLGLKVLLLVFILFLVQGPEHIARYALLISINAFIASLLGAIYVIAKEKLSLRLVSFRQSMAYIKEATPLFMSNALSTIKGSGVNNAIGLLFGMTALTAFDFGMKIAVASLIAIKALNGAIFPNIVTSLTRSKATRILKLEVVTASIFTGVVMLFAKPIIRFMGNGGIMDLVYPVFLTLNLLIVVWVLSGFFIDIILTSHGRYREIFYNQTLSFVALGLFVLISYMISKSILSFSIGFVASGLFEIAYLYYLTRRLANKGLILKPLAS